MLGFIKRRKIVFGTYRSITGGEPKTIFYVVRRAKRQLPAKCG